MDRQPRRRRRPALSCVECRRRKIKCDRNDPCAHCVSTKVQCVYMAYRNNERATQQPWDSASSTSTSAPSPLTQTQRTSANRPIIQQGNHPFEPQTGGPAADSPNILGRNYTQPTSHTLGAESSLSDLVQRIQLLERSLASGSPYALDQNGRDIFTRQSGLQDSQIFLKKTRTLRWSDWMGTAPEFSLIISCYFETIGNSQGDTFQDTETRALIVEISNLLRTSKNTVRNIKVGRSNCLSCSESGLITPPREVADVMATLYFKFESVYRILHEPTFWTEYQRFWDRPETATMDSRLRILLVIGIGSSLSGQVGTDAGFRNMVCQWIYAAQGWLSGPLKKDRMNISALQTHCLTLLARQIFSIGGDLTWVSMGSLIHKAMRLGLHRDPKHLPPMSILQAELRRRLWATILEMVVQTSLDSAMPPRITVDEFDTEPPSNIDDNEIDESTTILQPHPRSTYTVTSMQLLLLESLPIRFRILHLLNGLRSEISYFDVLSLSQEITDACSACSTFVKGHEGSGITPFHQNLLHYFMRRFILPLHCPFASKARKSPLFYYSVKATVDAALAIISPEPDESFSHLMIRGAGLFREGINLAGIAISLELYAQVDAQRLNGTLHRNSHYREPLKQAVKDMISLSLEQVRHGDTDVKQHMFLSMILAQVEAIETGTSCEFNIARSARDSLEICHNILQTLVGNVPSLGTGQEDYGWDDVDLEFFLPDPSFH